MSSILYRPVERSEGLRLATQMPSAWGDIPTIIKDIIARFGIASNRAIEFGVEWGFSTSAIANHFQEVIGIDTFEGDIHSGFKQDTFETTKGYLSEFPNINLVKASYQEYILSAREDDRYDFAHVDIVHTYEDTYSCGEWCIGRADVVVFHDTMSFPDVYRACADLADKHGLNFYNYEDSHGLGILSKRSI